jgi:hypothetical protein
VAAIFTTWDGSIPPLLSFTAHPGHFRDKNNEQLMNVAVEYGLYRGEGNKNDDVSELKG